MQWKTIKPKKRMSLEERQADLERWHIYFAWKPRQLITGNTAWLERIARRATSFSWKSIAIDVKTWEYTSRIEAATDVFKGMEV